MDRLFKILRPHFDNGYTNGQLIVTDEKRVVVDKETGKNISLTDSNGTMFYIRKNGKNDYDKIEETCDFGLNEVRSPIRIVARFRCGDMDQVESKLVALVSSEMDVDSSSCDYVEIIREEMGVDPKKKEHLVMIDGNIITQVAYSNCLCEDFNDCN